MQIADARGVDATNLRTPPEAVAEAPQVPEREQRRTSRAAADVGPAGSWLGRYRIVLEILAVCLLSFGLLRLLLVGVFADWRNTELSALWRLFWVGLRLDLLVGLCLILPQTMQLTVCSEQGVHRPVSRVLLEGSWIIAFLMLPFLWIAEIVFFNEFGSRLNYIAFEYLVYPKEVCCNIWQSYPIVPLLGLVGLVTAGLYFGLRKRFLGQLSVSTPWPRRYAVMAGVLASSAGLWLTSGMASMKISEDRVVNECSGNGPYSFVYYAWTCRFDYEQFYITMDRQEAFDRVRELVVHPDDQLHSNSQNPVDRTVGSAQPQRDWNVVLVLEESFGSDFVGVLGDDRQLTPNIDELSQHSLLFDNFYATGNRTARALEAVLTSMPPIPTEAILKRDHSDRVYTLAHVLEQRGYERLFMTGGRGVFDGVRSFMLANGFNRFLELSDYKDPIFTNAWGVSDEDLFHRAIRELNALHDAGQPFFATLLTVSNHAPFTYPAGRIPETDQSRSNAVKYADWALGDFFRQARQQPFFQNTLFVVMGDHGARVYGSQLFPMQSYRVPVLVVRPDEQGHGTRCSTLACSMDIAPTIMALLGGEYRSVFFGRDALSVPPPNGYALMQHNHDVALLTADRRMVVLGSNRSVNAFDLDPVSWELKRTAALDSRAIADTTAFFQSANRLYYDERWFPSAD